VRVALATCSRCTDSVAIHVHCSLCSDIKSFLVCSSFVAMSCNQIWEWFCKSETDASKPKCTECSKQLSSGSYKPAKQTVSGLKVHLEKFHKEQFVSYSGKLNALKAEPPAKKMKLDEQVSATPTLVQVSIRASTERSKQCPDDHPEVQRIKKSINVYSYWNCSQFPSLEPAARKYLSAPPTSVAGKQLFSAAGQIYADRCSNLIGENAEKLLFMAYNIRLLTTTIAYHDI